MPFRERIRRVFGRIPVSESSSPSALTLVPSTKSFHKTKKCDRNDGVTWPENVYKPEEIPPSKYRSAPDRRHQDRLHAFSFGNALENFRRKSGQSQYSPHGSRMPSRIGSVSGSFVSGKPSTLIQSRNASVAAPLDEPVAEVDETHIDASDGQPLNGNHELKNVPSYYPVKDQELGEALTPTQTAINRDIEGANLLSNAEKVLAPSAAAVRVDSAQATEGEELGDALFASKTVTDSDIHKANAVPDTQAELSRKITALRVEPNEKRILEV